MARPGENSVRELVNRFPELRPLLAEHMHDNYGEVLPHLFMADLMRYLVAMLGDYPADAGRSALEPVLNCLERTFSRGSPEARDLITTSFLEILPDAGERGHAIRGLLGTAMTAEANRVG
jgi:hypothetical protein